jgi:hypothetical protein
LRYYHGIGLEELRKTPNILRIAGLCCHFHAPSRGHVGLKAAFLEVWKAEIYSPEYLIKINFENNINIILMGHGAA